MRGSYENHPGFGIECPCQLKVNPAPYGMSSRGFACRYTGGHCLPDEHCDERVEEWETEFENEIL